VKKDPRASAMADLVDDLEEVMLYAQFKKAQRRGHEETVGAILSSTTAGH
jgi:hypothetical protein